MTDIESLDANEEVTLQFLLSLDASAIDGEELGIRIYSFPMRYLPTDRPDRGIVGDKWSKYAH